MRHVRDDDFVEINLWRQLRDVPLIPPGLYPPLGLIEDGIAAGFLTTTDTEMVLMENFITNPLAMRTERENAVLEIIDQLEKIARGRGYKYVTAVTHHPRIEYYIRLSEGRKMPGTIYGKEL